MHLPSSDDVADNIDSPLRGLGIFGSGWHRQNCKAQSLALTGLLLLADDDEDRSERSRRGSSLVVSMGPTGLEDLSGAVILWRRGS